jgi:site-specific recombinase XerD
MKLVEAIEKYISLKQSIGMRYKSQKEIFQEFQRYVGDVALAGVSTEQIKAFLGRRGRVTTTWLTKHRALRSFYQHWIARGRIKHTPVPTVVPRVAQNFVPHIYSNDEIQRLLATIPENQAQVGCEISAAMFRTLILLLYGTGLRISEALKLTQEDVDLRIGMILIRETKFYKSRQLPLGPTLVRALTDYSERSRGRGPTPSTKPFFVAKLGGFINRHTATLNFARLRKRAGVHGGPDSIYPPRLHDIRHSFAVNRLLAWYREGADVQRLLPQLSTYLGHGCLHSTQRYLTMVPELLEQASLRFERYARSEAHDE